MNISDHFRCHKNHVEIRHALLIIAVRDLGELGLEGSDTDSIVPNLIRGQRVRNKHITCHKTLRNQPVTKKRVFIFMFRKRIFGIIRAYIFHTLGSLIVILVK